jgi:hypothetical protein
MSRLIVAVLCLASSAIAAPIDPLLSKSELWTQNQDGFSHLSEAQPYDWTSNARDSARASRRDMTFLELPVYESVARFDSGKLAQITAELYARGDAGDIDKQKFDQLVHSAADALDKYTKVKFTARGKDAASAVHADGLMWQTTSAQYLLEYSFTKEVKSRNIPFRAEFVRLTISPPQRTVSLLSSASNANQARFSGLTHVKRDMNSGDVMISDVPMVDQGQKGYCAVACTERVMRYYGVPVDENELAQVANTGTEGGTSAEAMFEALKKLGARLHVRIHPIEQMEVKQLMSLISEYNRTARHEGAAPLPDQGHMIDVGGMFQAMKPDVLMEARTKNKAELTRFEHAVQGQIDQGIPLVWSVVLGLFPEKGVPQSGGGHMRLIIGYNNKTQEILFSDSWGAGHELKRMPLAQAVTITTGLTSIEPL